MIDAVAAELTAQGRAVRGVQADVRDAQRAQETVDEIVSQHERLDILVNCAGIVRDGLLGTMTADQWRDVIEIKVELLDGASQDEVERAIRTSLADLFQQSSKVFFGVLRRLYRNQAVFPCQPTETQRGSMQAG